MMSSLDCVDLVMQNECAFLIQEHHRQHYFFCVVLVERLHRFIYLHN